MEWLFPSSDADVDARLFNADGSEAEISGNGTRCVAAYICSTRGKEKVLIRTGAGIKTCTLTSRSDAQFEFETDMGEPQVDDELCLKVASREVRGIPVSMGNPHFVVFVDEFAPGWQAESAEIGGCRNFKQGVNVELVHIADNRNINVRFYERGVGETQSSEPDLVPPPSQPSQPRERNRLCECMLPGVYKLCAGKSRYFCEARPNSLSVESFSP